jgi:hypothetical protein
LPAHQMVLSASFPGPPPLRPPAAAAEAAFATVAPYMTHTPAVSAPYTRQFMQSCAAQQLACTATSAALALAGSGDAATGAASARACLLWLASLTAAGHRLSLPCASVAASEALTELLSTALPSAPYTAAGGYGDAGLTPVVPAATAAAQAACWRLVLLANAVCQAAVSAEYDRDRGSDLAACGAAGDDGDGVPGDAELRVRLCASAGLEVRWRAL